MLQLSDLNRIIVDEQGRLRFPPEEIRHAIPFLVFALDFPFDDLSDDVKNLCVDACNKAGVRSDTPVEKARELLARYYKKNPISEDFSSRLLRVLKGDIVGGGKSAQEAALSLLGNQRSTGVLGGTGNDKLPPGAVRGGALGRIALMTDKKPKQS